ncbi:recombinase family protein [Streptomyces malaysiensis]|uniref:Resolvase/invertase-type recombinase catalytic domain-containing protein n=1 Tax=Streptomyces malaysiensis TaxID=92644 RepID=A0A2J7Z164_STRMQ|nr:recombinase family protein [Streptomyces malaysiensis]PNG94020.1 hypothetical protein SMF913_10045 [Streptomyces malaysiensis]
MSHDFKRVESRDCPMSSCAAPAGSPCRTGKGKVAIQYHTARFRLVPHLAKALSVPTPAVRKPGSAWTELPRLVSAGAEPVGHVRLGYARASTARQSLDARFDSLAAAGVTRIFSEKISTRATKRPELETVVKLAGEIRSSGAAVTLVVHEHKRLGRGIELAMLAEELKASDVGLEFLTGELKGSHDPSGIVFTVLAAMSGMEREYIRDRTLEGHESARKRGKTIGGAGVTDPDMLVHGPPPARPGDEPARHRQAARHHHRHEEGPAPLTRHRHANAPRARREARHDGKRMITRYIAAGV